MSDLSRPFDRYRPPHAGLRARPLLLPVLAVIMACSTPPAQPPSPPAGAPVAAGGASAPSTPPPQGAPRSGAGGGAGAAYGVPSARGADVVVEESIPGVPPAVPLPAVPPGLGPAGTENAATTVPGRPGNTRAGVVHRDETAGGGGEVPGVAPRPDAPHRDSQTVPPPSPSTAMNADLRGPVAAGARASARETVDPATILARARAAAAPARNGRGAATPGTAATGADAAPATASGDGAQPDPVAAAEAASTRLPAAPSPGAAAPRADDAVARQLAALIEREPDPVLREKLRQEYRRYTAGR